MCAGAAADLTGKGHEPHDYWLGRRLKERFGAVKTDLDPNPILDAFEEQRGSFIDLDNSIVVAPDDVIRASYRVSGTLQKIAGVQAGDTVLMAIGNGPLFLATLVGILNAGASPLLLHGETPPPELRRNADRFGARFAIADATHESELRTVGFASGEFSHTPWAAGAWGRLDGPSWERNGSGGLTGVPLHPTSGTTGPPKLAARPGGCALAEARHYIDTIGIGKRDVVLCTVPMSHAYGYGMCVMVPLLSGAGVITMRRFDAATALKALNEFPISIYPAAPASLDMLLIEAGGSPPRRARCITSAGAPLPERIAIEVRRRWTTTVRPLYGTTETGGISVARPDHDPRNAGSVGPPMDGVLLDVRPFDREGDIDHDIGQLAVSSSSLMAGYVGPGGLDDSAVANGWFETGDLARINGSGNVILRGRQSEVINVFGMRVLPGEVEEVIAQLPQVHEVKVYGVSNRWGSHTVSAAVVANGMTKAELRAHLREHLAPYKRPMRIAMLDRLPRSPAGKIVVADLP